MIRKTLFVLFICYFFVSCEKFPEFLGDYFNGFINDVEINSYEFDQKYQTALIYERYKRCLTDKGELIKRGELKIAFYLDLNTTFSTCFFIGGLDEIKGMKFKNFTIPALSATYDCEKIPQNKTGIYQFITKPDTIEYKYIADKENYLKIDEVENKYIGGHFKMKFIRKEFMDNGIQSKDKIAMPDSIVIDCRRFYAYVRGW
jgi:hypothetical protein